MRVGHAGATTVRIIWAFNSRQILIDLRMWAPMSSRDSGGGQMYGCQTTAHAPAKQGCPRALLNARATWFYFADCGLRHRALARMHVCLRRLQVMSGGGGSAVMSGHARHPAGRRQCLGRCVMARAQLSLVRVAHFIG